MNDDELKARHIVFYLIHLQYVGFYENNRLSEYKCEQSEDGSYYIITKIKRAAEDEQKSLREFL